MKEKKEIKMSLESFITIIILLVILLVGAVVLGISALKPRLGEQNVNKVQEIVNKESYEENNENKTEKTYTEIYSSMGLENLETLRIYNDNTLTIKLSEHGRTLPKELPVIEANKEYSITGISDKIKVAKFITPILGGSYEGSYLFIKTEKNELYLVYTVDGLRTGKFEAVKVLIDDYNEEWPILDVRFNSEGFEEPIIIANTIDGKYIIKSDGTLEKYEDATEEIAKELFEKGSKLIRDIEASELCGYDYVQGSGEVERNGKRYLNTGTLYSDAEKKYAEVFTGKALEEYLKSRFLNKDGYLYVSIGGATGCGITNIKLEENSKLNDEITYTVIYNHIYINDSMSANETCEMTIKLVDGQYRISATNYSSFM